MKRATDKAIVLKDGRTLGYAEYGDPMGAPIMLFHGTPGSRLAGAMFDQVAREHQVRIFVADRPGYATSSPARHGSLLDFADDTDALADALHLDTFSLLGVSGGGPFALGYTSKFPQRVNRCALMSTIGPLALPHSMDNMVSVNRTFFRIARFVPALPGLLVPRQIKSSMKSMQKYIDEGTSPLADVPPAVFAPMMADQLEAVRAGGKGVSFDFGILTRDWGFQLEKIHTRVFMWHGAEDDLAPVALARYVAERIPDCVIKIIPGAGHAGTYSCVDEVMNTLVGS